LSRAYAWTMLSNRSARRATILVLIALASVAALPESSFARTASPRSPSPFLGAPFFVDPGSNARRQAEQWRQTRPADAAVMDRIGAQPQAYWFGDWGGDVRADVAAYVASAQAAGSVAVLVAYNIPGRDCGGHSAHGAPSPAAYRSWIREFAAGLGQARVAVILEPAALANLECLPRARRKTRLRLLKRAVAILRSDRQAAVYIDAGYRSGLSARKIASRLRGAGVRRARGFSLNVADFGRTAGEIAYGKAISARIGRKPFVIDTGRNGAGPARDRQGCNPPGRALGAAPTARTGRKAVDAFLWIKPPGESDGLCNGGPTAGAWWPEYALELARRTGW
jgi:endoglucanase